MKIPTGALFICPACGEEGTGMLVVEIDPVSPVIENKIVKMTGTIKGLEISHNCIPQTIRGRGRVHEQPGSPE